MKSLVLAADAQLGADAGG